MVQHANQFISLTILTFMQGVFDAIVKANLSYDQVSMQCFVGGCACGCVCSNKLMRFLPLLYIICECVQVASGPLTALLLQLKRKTSQDVLLQKLAKGTLQRLKAKFRKCHEAAMSAKRQSSTTKSVKGSNDGRFPDANCIRKDSQGVLNSSQPTSLSSRDRDDDDRDTFVNLLQ